MYKRPFPSRLPDSRFPDVPIAVRGHPPHSRTSDFKGKWACASCPPPGLRPVRFPDFPISRPISRFPDFPMSRLPSAATLHTVKLSFSKEDAHAPPIRPLVGAVSDFPASHLPASYTPFPISQFPVPISNCQIPTFHWPIPLSVYHFPFPIIHYPIHTCHFRHSIVNL